jgi:hypothetical protein
MAKRMLDGIEKDRSQKMEEDQYLGHLVDEWEG